MLVLARPGFDDNYALTGNGLEIIQAAVDFIEGGGSATEATFLIAGLARLTPDRIYRSQ